MNDVMDSVRQEFPQVVDWLEALLSRDDFAFIAGSRVVGLGNAGSDFDIIPVFERSVPAMLVRKAGPRLPRLVMSPDNRLLNVEDGLSLDDVAEIRRQIEALDPSDAQELLAPDLPLRLDTYFRFCIGVPAVNPEAFRAVASQFDTAVYRRVAAAWLVVVCQKSLTEARFWAGNEQADAARMALEQALSYAIGSHLLSRGELYRPWERWRYEELQRTESADSTFRQRAWDLKAAGTRGLPQYQSEVEAFCLETIGEERSFQGCVACTVQAARGVTALALDEDFFLIKNSSYCYQLIHTDAAMVWDRLERGSDFAALPLAGSSRSPEAALDADPRTEGSLAFLLELERAGLVDIKLSYRPDGVEVETAGSNDSVLPRLQRIEQSPGQLVLARFYGHLIRGGFYSRPWASVMGAIRMEQWGIAVVRARDALRGAVDAALAMSGVAYTVDLRHGRRALLEGWGQDGPALAARYIDLELDNPITPEDVLAYIERCGEFIACILQGFPINSREAELTLDERHSLLLESIANAAKHAALFGASTPLSPDAVHSVIAFREAVASSLIIGRRR